MQENLNNKCEENGVYLTFIDPKYTSVTCPMCKHVDKLNRDKEKFKCVKCGYKQDADYVGALNILSKFNEESSFKSDIVPHSTKKNKCYV